MIEAAHLTCLFWTAARVERDAGARLIHLG
jgi:hypothetical protein